MRFYKLKALSVSGKNNRVLRKEDNNVYQEDAWEEGRAEQLVKAGFLERVEKKKEEKKPEPPKVEEKVEEKIDEIPAYDDVTASTIKANLTASGVKFKPYDTKKVLYKLLYGVDA